MKKTTSIEMASILGCYVNRWQRWVAEGLQGFKIVVYDARNQYQQGLIQIER
jgi:phage/plasmid-associated DNA primase